MPEVKIKFYKPPKSRFENQRSLKNIKQCYTTYLFTTKYNREFEALEIDTANSSGAKTIL